jgi:hypothetical protein
MMHFYSGPPMHFCSGVDRRAKAKKWQEKAIVQRQLRWWVGDD